MSAQSTKTTTAKSTPIARKVPLHKAQVQLQIVEELLNQLEVLTIAEPDEDLDLTDAEAAHLIEQKQQALALELQQLQQENQVFYEQAVNRMLNRAAFETRVPFLPLSELECDKVAVRQCPGLAKYPMLLTFAAGSPGLAMQAYHWLWGLPRELKTEFAQFAPPSPTAGVLKPLFALTSIPCQLVHLHHI